jgi:hypothetical protein
MSNILIITIASSMLPLIMPVYVLVYWRYLRFCNKTLIWFLAMLTQAVGSLNIAQGMTFGKFSQRLRYLR